MAPEHRAQLTWSPEQVRAGLPAFARTTDPAWFDGEQSGTHDDWSLVCAFAPPLRDQGSPTIARVRFMMVHAPFARLRAGTALWLFERDTGRLARVDILD